MGGDWDGWERGGRESGTQHEQQEQGARRQLEPASLAHVVFPFSCSQLFAAAALLLALDAHLSREHTAGAARAAAAGIAPRRAA